MTFDPKRTRGISTTDADALVAEAAAYMDCKTKNPRHRSRGAEIGACGCKRDGVTLFGELLNATAHLNAFVKSV